MIQSHILIRSLAQMIPNLLVKVGIGVVYKEQHVGPRICGGHAHPAVGPQATANLPTWSDTVCAKTRLNFQGIPGIHDEPSDLSSSLAFLKTLFTVELGESFVNFTNKYADIIINDPAIQVQVARKQLNVCHLWKNTNKDEMWL